MGRRLGRVAVALLALALLPGCIGTTEGPRPSAFFCGGTWNLPPSFHGNFWAPGGDGTYRPFVFEPLFLFEPATGAFLPRLGLSYDLAPDRCSLTVRLRPGVLWHDGEPFRSRDVVTSYRLGYLLGWPLWQWLRLSSMEAPDDLTLRFTWDSPATERTVVDTVAFSEVCYPTHLYGRWDEAVPPLVARERALSAAMTPGSTPTAEQGAAFEVLALAKKAVRDELFRLRPPLPVGTGPYRMVRVTADTQRMVRFARGWAAAKVAVDEVRMVRVPDNRMAWAALIGGELDASNAAAPREVADRILALNPRMRLGVASDLQEFGFIFNCSRPPFSDPVLRRAVAHALDRETMTRVSYPYSRAVVDYSTGVLLSYRDRFLSPAFLSSLTPLAHSEEKAEKLLVEAGYARLGGGGPWLRPDGSPLTLELLTAPNSDWVMGTEVAASQLTAFGIPSKVRIMPGELAAMRLFQGHFDMAAEMGADYRRYGLPATTYERFYGRGGLVARASGVADAVRRSRGLDVETMASRLGGGEGFVDEAEGRRLVETLARVTNEELPFLAVYEKGLMVFHLDGVRVTGWPATDDSRFSLAGSGLETVFAAFLVDGSLQGVRP